MQSNSRRIVAPVSNRISDWLGNWRLLRLSRQIARHADLDPGVQPVAFFNASTRLKGISLNSAFAFLVACGLQVAGIPVVYFACDAGMSRCVLGTNRDDPSQPPPCGGCKSQAQWLFAHAPTIWFNYAPDHLLKEKLKNLNVEQLSRFEISASSEDGLTIPLGPLVLPSLRWALRRHNLQDDEGTRFLFREYILSANRIASEFDSFLTRVEPRCVVVFNGIFYPEATARWVAQRKGLRVITHEVGFTPFSSFFTDGQATAYPINISADFSLTAEQERLLDVYLEKRFQGKFTMAGIRFWPEMQELDDAFQHRASGFHQMVTVFTNVVFDTSQVHANKVFPHMYAWLDLVLGLIREHPETLFVIRAHLDETRPGKESRESVKDWFDSNGVGDLPNTHFIEPDHYVSSYELIRGSKFIMVYNSSIGLEAAVMGAAVLCGGQARYTRYPTVYFPNEQSGYRDMAKEFLSLSNAIDVPDEFQTNARRFLYYQLFKASLPFNEFLENTSRPGFVRLRPISWKRLKTDRSRTMRVLVEGILQGRPFLMN